jgi:[histone H3]-lysine4 N-trimethyltransferase ASH1L
MMAALIAPARALSSEEPSTDVADTFSHVASLSSTPPTTVGDGMSISSETSKQEITVESTQVDITVSTTHNVPTFTAAAAAAAEQTPAPQAERIAEATAPLVDIDVPATPSTTAALTLDTPTSESSRPRRQRQSLPVYNLAKLSGTAVHGKRRANGDIVNEKKRRTISGPLPIDIEQQEQHGESPARPTLEALIKEVSSKKAPKKEVSASPMVKSAKNSKKRALSPEPPKRATRSTGMQAETLATKLSTLGKRGKKNFVQNLSKMTREMRRLQDTNEFSGIDTKPVLYTTWAKGKYVDPRVEPPAKKQKKAAEPVKDDTPEELAAVPQIPAPQRKVKKWMAHGLYSGQEGPLDYTRHLTPNEKKAIVDMPELIPSQTVNRVLPMPIFNGLRQLIQGRDFKLPFDICNPLPSGQPKPASWKLMTRSKLQLLPRHGQC